MILATHTEVTSASPATIWFFWSDVPRWPTWDHELEKVSLDGDFVLNGTGKIQPKGGGELPFVIVELEQGKRFVDKTSVFGAGLVFTHTIEPTPSGTKFTHLIEAKGIMAWFYALILGRKMRHGLPLAMQELKKQAEEYERKDKK